VLQLDFSIVNVALSPIQRHFEMPAAQLQWLVTGYALTFGALLLVGGRAADLLGRRRLLTFGLSLFAVASLAAGLAGSSLELIIARVIQGAGGAMVSPAALSLLTTMNAEGPARTRALAIWQAGTAAGATTGIIAGGLLTQYLGWRAIFLVNPPLIAVMLVLVPRLLPTGGQRFDVRGAILSTSALAALIFGLSSGQQHLGFIAVGQLWLAQITVGASYAITVLPGQADRVRHGPCVPDRLGRGHQRRAAKRSGTRGRAVHNRPADRRRYRPRHACDARGRARHKRTRIANGRIPLLVPRRRRHRRRRRRYCRQAAQLPILPTGTRAQGRRRIRVVA
jgi:MFS family permease